MTSRRSSAESSFSTRRMYSGTSATVIMIYCNPLDYIYVYKAATHTAWQNERRQQMEGAMTLDFALFLGEPGHGCA